MGELVTFPAKFVYYDKVEKHEELKKLLLEPILKDAEANKEYYNNHERWDCEVITSFFDNSKGMSILEQCPLLKDSIWKVVDAMMEKAHLNGLPKESWITQCWYNLYKKGYSQEIHQHCGSDFSGIYILQSNEPNKTVFYSEESHRLLNKSWRTDEIGEGTIMIFPSHFSHYVNPIEDDNRITIAFNITCEI